MTQYDALNLSNNLLSGFLPENICDLPLDWDDSYMDEYQGFDISDNQFCAPFLIVQSFVGNDTTNVVLKHFQLKAGGYCQCLKVIR